jgi:hypothetical protein
MHIQISSIFQVKMPLKGATTIFSTQWQWVCFFLHSGSFEDDCGLCKNSTSKDLFLTSCQHRFCCGCIKEHVHTIIQTQMALTNPTFANLAPCAQCPISRYLGSITAESFTVLKCWYNIENSIPLHFAKLCKTSSIIDFELLRPCQIRSGSCHRPSDKFQFFWGFSCKEELSRSEVMKLLGHQMFQDYERWLLSAYCELFGSLIIGQGLEKPAPLKLCLSSLCDPRKPTMVLSTSFPDLCPLKGMYICGSMTLDF